MENYEHFSYLHDEFLEFENNSSISYFIIIIQNLIYYPE